MAVLNLRRIRLADPHGAEQLAELRTQLGAEGETVSKQGRELTLKVFGEALAPIRVVERICAEVRRGGLEAVLRFTEQFDRVRLTADTLQVGAAELDRAHANADSAFLQTVRRVRQNIMSFQLGLLHGDAVLAVPGSHELRVRYRPMRRVGIMIPGGAAAYPSTLLMTVCPAQAAGVQEIAVCMPPTANGAYNSDLLAVCRELGVSEVYRIGGAQAVAALAYGVQGVPAVDMIVGPGNVFVALAKRLVYGQVAIDCVAGPSEIVVLADETASAEYVAADLIAQAEHSPGSSVLVTWQEALLDKVAIALEKQLAKLSRKLLAIDSLETFGAFVLARSRKEAIACVNQLAPEHLHISTCDMEAIAHEITNAGAIFLGPYTPVALGDYVAGPSHVLPTGGTARFASGLSANDFLRRSSILRFTQFGLGKMADDVCLLAEKEGLTAHAASVEIRLSDFDDSPGRNSTRGRFSHPARKHVEVPPS